MRRPERWIAALCFAAGAVLLANPLYLDGLLYYPTSGDNWAVGGQFHAAISALGLVAVLGATAITTSLPDRYGLAETIAAVAVATVVLFASYSSLVAGALAPPDTRILGYGHRKTFVAAVVAALFVVGGAVGGRCRRALAGVPLALLTGLGFVALAPWFRVPWADVLLLAFLPDVLGIPFVGTALYAVAVLFGGVLGALSRAPPPEGRAVR